MHRFEPIYEAFFIRYKANQHRTREGEGRVRGERARRGEGDSDGGVKRENGMGSW